MQTGKSQTEVQQRSGLELSFSNEELLQQIRWRDTKGITILSCVGRITAWYGTILGENVTFAMKIYVIRRLKSA